MAQAGFLRNFRIIKNFSDEPKVMVAGGRFGDLINQSDVGHNKTPESPGVTGVDFISCEKA
ncbi:MAG: hypothetical protein Q8Q86_00165 [Candidatus Daviesbacteria bacterium]|nr:hypothetical protein [Candidatus Daviesbacteria bacterium]